MYCMMCLRCSCVDVVILLCFDSLTIYYSYPHLYVSSLYMLLL
uniref:Uncharacterized protein n=1 Tax=Arundo donax TaxID=35708 RepID=A0A0A9EM03_ARUDO